MRTKYRIFLLLAFSILAGCTLYRLAEFNARYGPAAPVDRNMAGEAPDLVSFHEDVQPILEQRCDVCHSCYDAPCQLKMTSFEGIERGGSKKLVYDSARITADPPTRLSIDADTATAWRGLDFHPVLNERRQDPDANLDNSLLYRMLRLKQKNPLPETGLLSETFDLRLDHNYICTTVEDFAEFEEKYPLWGMPYALPGLPEQDHRTLVEWLRQGARVGPGPDMSAKAQRIVAEWEAFLNGDTPKQRLMSRYIYEHLFIGRIHFEGLPDREFYRLVRSKTPPGQPVAEINTTRPYDDPGVATCYYRFRRMDAVVAVKDHTVYRLNPKKLARYRELFLQPAYAVDRLPGYADDTKANAFKTFAAIPAESRYRFMLDDAAFFVMGFIKGPVCRGQIALNVINDHFFVAFTNPELDAISTDSAFLSEVSDFLRLPSEEESNIRILKVWRKYRGLQRQYLEARNRYLTKLDPSGKGRGMEFIWDGDGFNDNALLTIFRHFDSASVVKGFVGQLPETGWIIDYPLFERVHYLLVAGFNVYGNVGHQAETRIHMDYLRMEGESNFLSFLPPECRQRIWDGWYSGAREEAREYLAEQFHGTGRGTRVAFHTRDPQNEFFRKLLAHAGPAAVQHDFLNRCEQDDCRDPDAGPLEQAADRQIRRLTKIKGARLQPLPDVAFMHIVMNGGEKDLAYTLIRNKALSNNSMMFQEDRRRRIEDDTLTVVKGHMGSYPNAFSRIPFEELEAAVDIYLQVKDPVDYFMLARKYSIQRNSPDFWQEADWHYRTFMEREPVEGGVFDLYRFHRIGEKGDAERMAW
ncbi:MAG: fatty acid cis/trans isomerase [Thermodesulfobacteriota bacterium]